MKERTELLQLKRLQAMEQKHNELMAKLETERKSYEEKVTALENKENRIIMESMSKHFPSIYNLEPDELDIFF